MKGASTRFVEPTAEAPASKAAAASDAALGRRASQGIVLAAQLVGLVLFGVFDKSVRGLPLDDAWIHQVVARTFAASGTLGYSPGHFGAGATSYLWAALLAVNYRVFHADPTGFTLVVNAALYLATGQIFLAIVSSRAGARAPLSLTTSTVIAVAAALAGNFVWFAFSGMEATLLCALSLGAIAALVAPAVVTPRAALVAGACAGAAALTRPEAVTVVLVLLLVALRRGAALRHLAIVAGAVAFALAVYVGANLAWTGTAIPATLEGRRWLWFDAVGGVPRWALVADFGWLWADRLRQYTLADANPAEFWLVAGLAVAGLVRSIRERHLGLNAAVAWAALHVGTYIVLLPTYGHGGRYQPLVPLIFLALAALGSVTLLEGLVTRAPRLASRVGAWPVVVAAALPWFVVDVLDLALWRSDERAAVAHIARTEIALSDVVDALPAGDRVASFDIGAVGFFSHRPILDLGALTERRAADFLKRGELWEYLRENRIDVVVVPLAYSEFPEAVNFGFRLHLTQNAHLELAPIAELQSPFEAWWPSIRSTWNSAPRQVAFRVRYVDVPEPARAPPGVSTLDDPDSFLDRRARARTEFTDAVLARAGAPVHLRISTEVAAPVGDPSEWRVALGPWGVSVAPPQGAAVSADAATASMSAWLREFIDKRDVSGAARAVGYGIMKVVQRHGDPTFFPMLPPVDFPLPPFVEPTPATTFKWGALLMIAVAFATSYAARRGPAPVPVSPARAEAA